MHTEPCIYTESLSAPVDDSDRGLFQSSKSTVEQPSAASSLTTNTLSMYVIDYLLVIIDFLQQMYKLPRYEQSYHVFLEWNTQLSFT